MIHADEGPNLDWQGRLGFDLRPRAQVLPDDACDSKGKMGDTRSCGIGRKWPMSAKGNVRRARIGLKCFTPAHGHGGLPRPLDFTAPGGGRPRPLLQRRRGGPSDLSEEKKERRCNATRTGRAATS